MAQPRFGPYVRKRLIVLAFAGGVLATGALAGPNEDLQACFDASNRDAVDQALVTCARAGASTDLPARHRATALGLQATILDRQGDIAAAVDVYARALQLYPQFASLHVLRARALVQLGRHAEAISDYSQFLERDKEEPAVLLERAQAYQQVGDVEHALADYGRLIALAPDHPWGYASRGVLLSNLGRHEQAIADFDQYVVHYPGAKSYASRCRAYVNKGDRQRAIADCRQALTYNRAYQPAIKILRELGVKP